MDVWRCFSGKDKVMDRRLRKDGWANLEVGIKMNDIFTFGKVIQARCHRAAAGFRVVATHFAAGSHTDVPLAQCCLPLPSILSFSKLLGK